MSGLYNPVTVIRGAAKIIGVREPSINECEYIAWEHTGYPCFFSETHGFEKQVLEFMREWKRLGQWPPHPLLGATR